MTQQMVGYYSLMFVFYSSHMIVAGYYGFTLDVRVSVLPPVVRPSVLLL